VPPVPHGSAPGRGWLIFLGLKSPKPMPGCVTMQRVSLGDQTKLPWRRRSACKTDNKQYCLWGRICHPEITLVKSAFQQSRSYQPHIEKFTQYSHRVYTSNIRCVEKIITVKLQRFCTPFVNFVLKILHFVQRDCDWLRLIISYCSLRLD